MYKQAFQLSRRGLFNTKSVALSRSMFLPTASAFAGSLRRHPDKTWAAELQKKVINAGKEATNKSLNVIQDYHTGKGNSNAGVDLIAAGNSDRIARELVTNFNGRIERALATQPAGLLRSEKSTLEARAREIVYQLSLANPSLYPANSYSPVSEYKRFLQFPNIPCANRNKNWLEELCNQVVYCYLHFEKRIFAIEHFHARDQFIPLIDSKKFMVVRFFEFAAKEYTNKGPGDLPLPTKKVITNKATQLINELQQASCANDSDLVAIARQAGESKPDLSQHVKPSRCNP